MKNAKTIAASLILMAGAIACIGFATPSATTPGAGTASNEPQDTRLGSSSRAPLELAVLEQELVPDAPRLVITEENQQHIVDIELARLLELQAATKSAR